MQVFHSASFVASRNRRLGALPFSGRDAGCTIFTRELNEVFEMP